MDSAKIVVLCCTVTPIENTSGFTVGLGLLIYGLQYTAGNSIILLDFRIDDNTINDLNIAIDCLPFPKHKPSLQAQPWVLLKDSKDYLSC